MAKTRKTKPTLVLPEVVAKSPVMRRHRITAKSLPKFNRDMLVAWSPTMLHVWFTKTWEAAMGGEKGALDDIAEIYGLIAKRGAGSMVDGNVRGGAGGGVPAVRARRVRWLISASGIRLWIRS